MLFSSAEFLFVFLPVVLGGGMIIRRLGGRHLLLAWLVAASLGFYAWWNPPHIAVLLTSVAVNFGLGRLLYKWRSRWLLGLGISLNLLALGYFKYANFLVENVNALAGTHYPTGEIVLPLAISFITFQKIAYLCDVYHRRTSDRSLPHYLLFASFFPQLIAGPIVHHREIVPQLTETRFGRFAAGDLRRGGLMFLMGLCKKALLANGMAPYADALFNAPGEPGLIEAWGGALAYTFQIYFDFSGYTDMALGLGLMFGLALPLNFASPYKATSIIDFWRRWHITLSHFLRDSLYVPLGGSRRGETRRHVNLLATMLLGGLWHGAAWTYVAWGGLHGLFLVLNHLWRRHVRQEPGALGRWTGRAATFIAVVVAWVFFRAADFESALRVLEGMAGANGVAQAAAEGRFDATLFTWEIGLLALVWLFPNTQQWLSYGGPDSYDTAIAARRLPPAWLALPAAAAAVLAVCLVLLSPAGKNQPFIYMIF